MQILKSKTAILALCVCTSACAAVPRDILTRSHAARLKETVQSVELDAKLAELLSKPAGNRYVLTQMESSTHVNDEAMTYLIQDVLREKLVKSSAKFVMLERDMDVLNLIRQELSEIEVKIVRKDEAISIPDAARRKLLGDFMKGMAKGLSLNDAFVFSAENNVRNPDLKVIENIASNEIGQYKLALLKELIQQIREIYPINDSGKDDATSVEKLKLLGATHMLTYRIYDFGILLFPDGGYFSKTVTRQSHIQLYIEIVEIATGTVQYAGYVSKTLEDQLIKKYLGAYSKVRPKDYDFSRPGYRGPRISRRDESSSWLSGLLGGGN